MKNTPENFDIQTKWIAPFPGLPSLGSEKPVSKRWRKTAACVTDSILLVVQGSKPGIWNDKMQQKSEVRVDAWAGAALKLKLAIRKLS